GGEALSVDLPGLAGLDQLALDVVNAQGKVVGKSRAARGDQLAGGQHCIVRKRTVDVGKEVLGQPVLVDQTVVVRHGRTADNVAVAVIFQGDDHNVPKRRRRSILRNGGEGG